MTKEEAKEILTHNWTRVDNPNYSESELDEAFFMAIEALHTEVVLCKDCRYQIKEKGIMWCSHEDGVCGDAPDNFYCGHGEKEDEE